MSYDGLSIGIIVQSDGELYNYFRLTKHFIITSNLSKNCKCLNPT